jgi:hypothetical protein
MNIEQGQAEARLEQDKRHVKSTLFTQQDELIKQ